HVGAEGGGRRFNRAEFRSEQQAGEENRDGEDEGGERSDQRRRTGNAVEGNEIGAGDAGEDAEQSPRPWPRVALFPDHKVGQQKRGKNGGDHDAVDLPRRPKIQSQPADDLRFQQQESGAHAEEKQRRNAGAGFGNLEIKKSREQNDERAEQVEDARNPVSLVVEIGPIVGGDGNSRQGEKRRMAGSEKLMQAKISG